MSSSSIFPNAPSETITIWTRRFLIALTDPEAFLPEVIGEAVLAMEGKSEQKT